MLHVEQYCYFGQNSQLFQDLLRKVSNVTHENDDLIAQDFAIGFVRRHLIIKCMSH